MHSLRDIIVVPETTTFGITGMQPSYRVSIIILNWNGASDTLGCLDSLTALTYPNFNVIVVDNGSTDDSLVRLRPYTAPYPLTLFETGRNLGYAGGNNIGIRQALELGADFVLVLNNDTTVAPDLLERLLESAQRNPDAGVFSARIMYFDEPDRVWFDGARWNPSSLQLEWPGQDAEEHAIGTVDHDTDYASGAALFFRSEVARQIGLLDEAFFLVWEEVDWCFRARKAGWRNIIVPAAKVWHKIGVSFGSESSPLRTYFSIRNQLLWFSRHTSLSTQIRLWTKNLRRLIPMFHIIPNRNVSFAKRFGWALQDYGQAWLGRGSRVEYLAARRAIMDFVHRRFGDCPDEVRVWSRVRAARQRNA
jgi:GT2 family glycosyltransferase